MWCIETYKPDRNAPGGIFQSYEWYVVVRSKYLLVILDWYAHNEDVQDFNAIRLRNMKTDEVWQEERLWESGPSPQWRVRGNDSPDHE